MASVAMFPLNLPNVLTVLRIMLVPALVVALLGNTPDGDVHRGDRVRARVADRLRRRLPRACA